MMEKIQRRLLMLRPTDGFSRCKDDMPLRLQSEEKGISAALTAACLSGDEYDAYLLLSGGEFRKAGRISDGKLNTSAPNIALDDIIGAAVVHTANGQPAFCLVSTGMDWHDAAARFKIAHTKDHPAAAVHTDSPQLTSAHPLPVQNEPPQTPAELPQTEPRPCDACPQTARQRRIDPFPSVFPGSEWIKITYPGPTGWWHYISGTVDYAATNNESPGVNRIARVIGVPGDYGVTPPVWLEGFSTYLHSAAEDARGYWLLFQDAQTGDVLNMDLSQHGG